MRIEKLIMSDGMFQKGYTVLLTNDPSYWKKPIKENSCDKSFRINEGAEKTGELTWSEHTGEGTKRNREQPIFLRGSYKFQWKDYSIISDERWGQFRFLPIEVGCRSDKNSRFWVYENWVAEKKAVIHKAACSYCNNGMGIQKNKHGNKNGKWHGPFSSYKEAYSFASSLKNRKLRMCGFCTPNIE